MTVSQLPQVSYLNRHASASGPAVTPNRSDPRRRLSGLDAIRPGAKVLWVTSTGGHLAEVDLIARRIRAGADSTWVTFESPQSAALVGDRPHLYVDYVAPRDLSGALRAARQVTPLIRSEHFDACISTGAAVAATVLPIAAWSGIPTYYVESLARAMSPSTTGKILARVPGVQTLTQYRSWAAGSWEYAGSTLDEWQATEKPAAAGPLKILVTLGTIGRYRFDRAVDAVLSLLRPEDEVVWQLGATSRTGLPGQVLDQVTPSRLATLSHRADVVVAHSGVGSVLQQFALGNSPVLAVRRADRGEHVDNHQVELAATVAERGLATVLDLDRPTRSALEAAAGRTVTTQGGTPAALAAR